VIVNHVIISSFLHPPFVLAPEILSGLRCIPIIRNFSSNLPPIILLPAILDDPGFHDKAAGIKPTPLHTGNTSGDGRQEKNRKANNIKVLALFRIWVYQRASHKKAVA